MNAKTSERDFRAFLADLELLREGRFRMTKQQFRNALKRSIGATKDYADGCWIPFQDSPLDYILSRSHVEQKLELIKLCIRLGERSAKAKQNERREGSDRPLQKSATADSPSGEDEGLHSSPNAGSGG